MIKSTLSFSWTSYAGKYGVPMLQCYAEILEHVKNSIPAMKSKAAGQRALRFQNAGETMFRHPNDLLGGKYGTLWWNNGIADWKQRFAANVEALFAGGVKLEFAVFDIESCPSGWTLDAASLAAIYADPRYKALVATGNFPADCRNMNFATIMQFNYGCFSLFYAAVQEALIAPLHARYPNLPWSNFQDFPLNKADAAVATDPNGNAQHMPKSTATHYSPAFYGTIGNLKGQNPLFKLPWTCVALSNNTVRGIYRADPAAKIMPWLAPRAESNTLDLPHWQELMYHMFCLCGPQALYFNAADSSALANWRFDNSVTQFVAQTKGSAWKSCVTTDMTDYGKAAAEVSACRLASGTTLGRATFKPDVTTATVKVAGRSITLKRPAGGLGVWFKF